MLLPLFQPTLRERKEGEELPQCMVQLCGSTKSMLRKIILSLRIKSSCSRNEEYNNNFNTEKGGLLLTDWDSHMSHCTHCSVFTEE
jgi:hypothetical protein